MKTKYIVYALLVVAIGGLIAYRISKNQNKSATGFPGANATGGKGGKAGAMPPTRVNGVIVKTENFANSLSLTGSIEANEQVDIRSEVPGLVTAINFNEGSNVSKGQVLVKINDRELQAQLAQALTKQKLASETEFRANTLLKKEAISKEEYDVALADLRSLQSQTQLIRAQLSKTQIRAPFSGKIGLRYISVGEYVTPTSTIAKLVSINPVKILFSIPEKYSQQIKSNSTFKFTVAGSDNSHVAKVYAIEPGVDLTTRTLLLKAKADNASGDLLPGSFTKIDLPLSNVNDAILIPTESIIPVLKGKKVFISENGKAKEVMIETGTRTPKSVLVSSGLKVGDTVLTTGMMSLKADVPVIVSIK
ncbi:MAG: cation transporter [Sphingobacteriales bacterium]|nr:cation transporter [Sphingobacteriales bacterium]